MPVFTHSRPARLVTAAVTAGCFVFGFVGTEATHRATVHRAVAEARAAAVSLEDSRRTLETSLSQAAYSATNSTALAEVPQVTRATQLVSIRMDAATLVATKLDVAVEHATPGATPPWRYDAAVRSSLFAAAGPPAPAPASNDVAVDALQDPEVAEVLAGDAQDAETALEVRDKLETAAANLDVAAERLEGAITVLEQETEAALLAEAAADLTAQVAAADASVAHASAMVTAAGNSLADRSTAAELAIAADALAAAAQTATGADTDDLAAVESLSLSLADASARVAAAEDAVRASHAAWREEVNAARAQANDAALAEWALQVQAAESAATGAFQEAVRSNQRGWNGRPPGVTASNGTLPTSQLCRLSYATHHWLQCEAAHALERADAAYHDQTGRHLVPNSSYRSLRSQYAARSSRGGFAAPAGTSNHGWGMAVDLPSHAAAWLRANGAAYGWVHPTWARPGGSLPESWHLEFVAPFVTIDAPARPALKPEAPDALADL